MIRAFPLFILPERAAAQGELSASSNPTSVSVFSEGKEPDGVKSDGKAADV
jgi:hypothetical protein